MSKKRPTPSELGQRSHKGPALLTKLFVRRKRDDTDTDEENA